MQDVGDIVEKAFAETVSTWDKKPTFYKKTEEGAKGIVLSVYTDNTIYGYVSRGTKPHNIPKTPRNKVLRFQTGFVAKTVPGVLRARSGGASGEWRFVNVKNKTIRHPGIKKPRNFPMRVKKVTSRYVKMKFQQLGKKLKMELT